MNNHLIARLVTAAVLSLTAALAAVWARPVRSSLPSGDSGSEQTLTGIVSDSICKVQNYPSHHKGVTRFSCTLECVHHEGADYVLVVDDSVYVLDGHRGDLDNFAGGRASVTGHVDGNRVSVESVTAVKK